jgi:hypothetical protein
MNPCRLIITAILLLLASTAGAKTLIVPPRPGQVGLSVQGQYGTLLESGALGEDFGNGPGLAVRLRYRMRYERALGLSFESQGYDTRTTAKFNDVVTGLPLALSDPFAPAKATLITSGVDFYKMFGTRTSTTRMLSASAGLAQVHLSLNDKETEYLPDGLYLGAGAGIEKFFWGSWAWDLSARYMALFDDGSTNHLFQASLGLVVYASY